MRLHCVVTALVPSTFRCLAAICAREVERKGTQRTFTWNTHGARYILICCTWSVLFFFSFYSYSQVCTLKGHELTSHIPVTSLPEHLGGTSQYSHVAWIQSCVNIRNNTVQTDTHDCVGSLLRSYSLDCSNPSAGSELPVANSNCYDDKNANPHNHCGVIDGKTQVSGQYQLSASNRLQGNHQHCNGSAVSGGPGVSDSNPNANVNGRGHQAPPQSDTPPDTPLSQEGAEDVVDGKARDCPTRSQNEDVTEEGAVPPLPQKSLPRPPHQPYSQSSPLSSSWGPDDEERYMEVSVHMPEQGGMTVRELVDYVKRKKKKGIYQEYEDIRKEPPAGTFDYSK